MRDRFGDSIVTLLLEDMRRLGLDAKVGEAEKQILELFYDETHKVRRDVVPKFMIYGRLCDGKSEMSWSTIMNRADKALLNLRRAEYIEESKTNLVGSDTRHYVGGAADQYKLTLRGQDNLARIRYPLALRAKAWIVVLPPWVLLLGSIAGGLSAAWGIARLVLTLAGT